MKIGYLKKREKKMPNHKEGFNDRIKCNEAESKFEDFCESNDIMFYKFGIDNHPFGNKFWKVNKLIRCTPDYIIMGNITCLVEVKGCVNDIKLKEKDFNAYKFWNKIMPVHYCFYFKARNEIKLTTHNDLLNVLPSCETMNLNDSHKYDDKLCYIIRWNTI